ncbi:PI-stichotoxin-Hcr2f-like [Parasteatoda tepidariorum]|uniref:PI-stichotoxin-Hcr2f-like n=1 Tax=Parasteatoda tepidariorum TaxID=114398 RepID=UPI001C729C40|nr:PI-stichotoxin-Hcr2f-like [Parasteatoda tepidariorum]
MKSIILLCALALFVAVCGADDVCSLPSETGPCRAAARRFFFDKASGECKPFTYGGCQGNGNNFVTEKECQDACA